MVINYFQYGLFPFLYLFLLGFFIPMKAQDSVITFNGKGDGYSWTDPLNWEENKVPNPEKQSITIPEGFSVFYTSSLSLNFKDSSIFKICGKMNFGIAHLHMREYSSLKICSSAEFIGHEIKLYQNARGYINKKASVEIKEIETRGNSTLTIDAQCIKILSELKNRDNATINGKGCFDFTGINYVNTGKGGIFNCFSSDFEYCNFLHLTLPEIIDFSGNIINNTIVLNWTSITEPEGGYYEILISKDKKKYELIKYVEGKEASEYNEGFTPNFLGLIHVKINFVDVSGIKSYSNQTSLLYKHSEEGEKISIYPNPAKKSISVMNLKLNETYLTNIYAPDGVLLITTSISLENNSVSIANLNQGNYYIELIDSKKFKTVLRFVKSK